jgi:hypothetical protein
MSERWIQRLHIGAFQSRQGTKKNKFLMKDTAMISRLDRIEKMLSVLLGEKQKKTWVKAGDIIKLTGWNREKLRQRRLDGIVEFKKTDKGFFYNPDSIPAILIKSQTI